SAQPIQSSAPDSPAVSVPVGDRTETDQRLFAVRRIRDGNKLNDDPPEPTASSRDPAEPPDVSGLAPPKKLPDPSEEETNEKNPRKLLKKARRQALAGSLVDAID